MWTAVTRGVQRLMNTAGLLALLGGVPLAQARYIGSPLPDHSPTLAELRTALTSRDWLTDATYLDGLSVLLWLLWLLFTVSVVIEVAAVVRGVRAPRYRLLAPTQGLAAALIAGITATIVVAAPAAPLTAALTGPAAQSSPPAAVVVHADTPHRSTPTGHLAAATVAATFRPVGTVTLMINGAPVEHTVTRGESLWGIASEYLGDGDRWTEIWEANKGRYWPHISGRTRFNDPDLIFPGWVLTMPTNAAPPANAPPSTPPPQDPPGASTAPPATAPPATTTPPTTAAPTTTPPSADSCASATASPSATANPPSCNGDDGVFVPPATTGTPSSPSASAPSPSTTSPSPSVAQTSGTTPATDTADDSSPDPMPGWVEVAGGAMGVGLAAGLIYAGATVWKRRRHRYRPTPITSPVLRDPDLSPPMAALTRLRQSVRRAAPQLLDSIPDRGPTVREYVSADIKPVLPPTGPSGAELSGVGALPVTSGLGLDGSAALDAARALLVATLTSGDADDPDAQGRVIVPAATLATLLGVSAVDLDPMRRLTVAPTFAAALTLLEEEIIRRSRIIADQEAATVFALRDQWTFGEPLPQLLLIADAPDESWHTRLATAIRLGKNVDIGTALIGAWPEGTTLTIAADGSTEGGDGERVAVLDTTATTDILTMLAEAHGDAEPPTTIPTSPQEAAPTEAAPTPQPTIADATPGRRATTITATQAEKATADPAPGDTGEAITNGRVLARVLGEPAILGADGKPVRGLRAKSLELFVYLVVHRGGAARDDIMEAIWPDVTVSRAAERLSTCVANLRSIIRSVAQAGMDDADDPTKIEPVINTGGHYHLDSTLLQVDWWTVLDAYAQVATASDDTARLTHLRTAITAAPGGGLADGCGYEWIDTDREHARRRLVKIYAHAAGLQSESDPTAARTLYDTACTLDPLSDELARRAMRVSARLGDAAAVKGRLAALRRELDEAGIDIDPGTEELAADLLRALANP